MFGSVIIWLQICMVSNKERVMFAVMVDGQEQDRYEYMDDAKDVADHLAYWNSRYDIDVYIVEVKEDEDED